MFTTITSMALLGVTGYPVRVEVDVSDGFPRLDLVGLPDSAVRESVERVRTSIKNSKFSFPYKRITVNLAPAHIRKKGPAFDLPIAVGILTCTQVIEPSSLVDAAFIGELSLTGDIRPVLGVLSMVACAKARGVKRCYVPMANAPEGAVVQGISVIGVGCLKDLVAGLQGHCLLEPYTRSSSCLLEAPDSGKSPDFSDVQGQSRVKRALTIAAAGQHHVLMIGPPGSGKTMLANRMPSIMPKLSLTERIALTQIYSVCGLMPEGQSLVAGRPFRAPHHHTTVSALIGGGRIPKPGEISLAHHGVLFLDELPEFKKDVIEVLRQPLEEKQVTLSRTYGSVTFPADFVLVGAMNPCPCGFYPDASKCRCTPLQVKRYRDKLSGPLMDRLDLHVEVDSVSYEDLTAQEKALDSKTLLSQIQQAKAVQHERFLGPFFNAHMDHKAISSHCQLDKTTHNLLEQAFQQLQLSARSYHKILKVARTIADLEGAQTIDLDHVSEAISFRGLDRKDF